MGGTLNRSVLRQSWDELMLPHEKHLNMKLFPKLDSRTNIQMYVLHIYKTAEAWMRVTSKTLICGFTCRYVYGGNSRGFYWLQIY